MGSAWGEGGRGALGQNYAWICVCVQNERTWVRLWLKVSQMSENISLKMDVKIAASLNRPMGENLC